MMILKRTNGAFRRAVTTANFLLIAVVLSSGLSAQQGGVQFHSTDSSLLFSFNEAKRLALSYRGNPSDPVGPWYEAALPSRNAFCVRDVSHQTIGAEILGMAPENKNMMTKFVTNIAGSRDWCTYWEINKWDKPAPEDYRNDGAFWYNLNANFELVDASWRLYLWTGDKTYIEAPAFRNFFEKTITAYIRRWQLAPDQLLKRSLYLNSAVEFDSTDNFHRCRGLPSYYEARTDVRMGIDLVAAIARALKSYGAILVASGQRSAGRKYDRLSNTYANTLDKYWWDDSAGRYHTYYTGKNQFGDGEGATFLLWYDVLKDSAKANKTIGRLLQARLNVENRSYLPYQLCRYGYPDAAYKEIVALMDPATKRRDYPEVSYGVIEGIVQGIMGVSVDSRNNEVTTQYNLHSGDTCRLRNLPVLSGLIDLEQSDKSSSLLNNGDKLIRWTAAFRGRHSQLRINGKPVRSRVVKDGMGIVSSRVTVVIQPGQKATVSAGLR